MNLPDFDFILQSFIHNTLVKQTEAANGGVPKNFANFTGKQTPVLKHKEQLYLRKFANDCLKRNLVATINEMWIDIFAINVD